MKRSRITVHEGNSGETLEGRGHKKSRRYLVDFDNRSIWDDVYPRQTERDGLLVTQSDLKDRCGREADESKRKLVFRYWDD